MIDESVDQYQKAHSLVKRPRKKKYDEDRVAALVAIGTSIRATAKAVGVSPPTIFTLLSDERFKEKVEKIKFEAEGGIQSILEEYRAKTAKYFKRLDELIMKDGNVAVSVTALKEMLDRIGVVGKQQLEVTSKIEVPENVAVAIGRYMEIVRTDKKGELEAIETEVKNKNSESYGPPGGKFPTPVYYDKNNNLLIEGEEVKNGGK